MDKKIVLILLTVVFIAAAATSPELELVVMANESQINAQVCLEEDSSDLENTKTNNDQVENKYEAQAPAVRTAANDSRNEVAAVDVAAEAEPGTQVKSAAGNIESEAAETTDTRVKEAENKKIKQAYGDNDGTSMDAFCPKQSLTLDIDTGFYYVNLPADVKVGWIKIGSTWNYFDTSGRMFTVRLI